MVPSTLKYVGCNSAKTLPLPSAVVSWVLSTPRATSFPESLMTVLVWTSLEENIL